MSLISRDTYVFMDDISSETVRPVVEWILKENMYPKKERVSQLVLVIESAGGELSSLWCLVDIMNGSKIPVDTVGIGTVASAGFMAFITGKHKILTPNTTIMSHQYSEEMSGKHHDLLASHKEMELVNKRFEQHYKKCLKLPVKKIRELLLSPTDAWFSADEALALGICDEVRTV